MRSSLLTLFVLGAAACASETELPKQASGLGNGRCEQPNQTFVCTCGLDDGTQQCTEERTLTECSCFSKEPKAKPDPTPRPVTPAEPAPTDRCGNGQIDPGEACDDGNTTDDDGCSASCTPDGAPPSGESCPGQTVLVWKGKPVVLTGTTAGFKDSTQASCWSSRGPDRIYAIQPSEDGFMKIDAAFGPGFNAVVEVRRDACTSSSAQVLCEDTVTKPFQRVIQVEKSRRYFLVVDGDTASAAGAYTLRLELP